MIDKNKCYDAYHIWMNNGIKASGLKLGKLFLIFKNSMIRKDCVKSFSKRHRKYKEIVCRSPFVDTSGDFADTLTENLLVDSGSIAASIITGSSKSSDYWEIGRPDIFIPDKYVTISKNALISEKQIDFFKKITSEEYDSFKKEQKSNSGYLYIYQFEDLSALKIGQTYSPYDREKHSHQSPSFLDGYGELIYWFPVYCDPQFMERIVHSQLSNRIYRDIEYFYARECFSIDCL